MWRRLREDGADWEVRVLAREDETAPGEAPSEILEFRPLDGLRSPRRLVVPADSLAGMDDAALRMAYRRARPIGGDYYGRPGKWMNDTAA